MVLHFKLATLRAGQWSRLRRSRPTRPVPQLSENLRMFQSIHVLRSKDEEEEGDDDDGLEEGVSKSGAGNQKHVQAITSNLIYEYLMNHHDKNMGGLV